MSQTNCDGQGLGKANAFLSRLACGRTMDEQIEDVRTHGNHGAVPVLRAGVLTAHGIAKPKDTAETAVLFGCYRPFTTPHLLRDALALLDLLGVDYTWLDKEYCCGLPLLGQASGEDRPAAKAASREFIGKNRDLARAKGAEKLAYCCAGCAYAARGTFQKEQGEHGGRSGSARDEHVYILDLLLDHLESMPLRVEPMVLGYFEGCHTHYAPHYPGGALDWPRYRRFLDTIEGLRVVDLPTLCCKRQPDTIIAKAEQANLDKLVCACSGCTAGLREAARGKVRIMSYPELLLKGVGVDRND